MAPSPAYPQKELQAEVPGVRSFSSLYISKSLENSLPEQAQFVLDPELEI